MVVIVELSLLMKQIACTTLHEFLTKNHNQSSFSSAGLENMK